MARHRAPDFAFDAVHRDTFGGELLDADASREFWRAWVTAFNEFDWEHTRTIVTESIAVCEWIYCGEQDGPLDNIFGFNVPGCGRVVRFRGTSICEFRDGRITRETMYMDLATLMIELGITP
ncbi:MAG: ester cyclase [Gammaproteobacteria bacterium]|nr:ester cyclase [Gammaproteobacteria bacterium]